MAQKVKDPIIILHGWGISGSKYHELQKLLEKDFKVYSPDMPGFGSEKLKKDMVLDDYLDFLLGFMKKKKISKAILLGHSFGGRVAAKFASIHPEKVSKLILTGAPLIKKPLSFKKQFAGIVAKTGKRIVPASIFYLARKVLYRSIGEWDYYKAGELSKTLQNIIAEDLREILPKIKVPTLLIWGKNDTFVKLEIGNEISNLIKSSKIEILEGSHRIPYENPETFYNAIYKFIND